MIYDDKAEKLEQAGLYRRAAARWLTVLDQCRDVSSREWIARRRRWCIEQAETPRPLTDTFGDVRRPPRNYRKAWDSGSLTGMLSGKSKSIHHVNRRFCRVLNPACKRMNVKKYEIRLHFSGCILHTL